MQLIQKIKRILSKIKRAKALSSQKGFHKYLIANGILLGEGVFFQQPKTCNIDLTRPSLIKIGNNCYFNSNLTLLTHDWVTYIFRNKYHDFINSSGKITIGNNVSTGTSVTILKGVTIGDNVFIGANSLVNKDIPSNSIAAGVHAKVICSLDDYYHRRQEECIAEAIEYANSIRERFHREPVIEDFWEEFHLFVNGNEIDKYPTIPIKAQLGPAYDSWKENHKSIFSGFEDFLSKTKIQ